MRCAHHPVRERLLKTSVCVHAGWGPVITAESNISDSLLGRTMSAGVMSVIGSISAGILNQYDLTRFAKKPSGVTWSQGITFSLASKLTSLVGVLVSAATQERECFAPHFRCVELICVPEYGHGTALWDPTQHFLEIQSQHGSRGRAAAFFLAMSSVLPNPWQQLASGSTFLAVLSACSVFGIDDRLVVCEL